MSSRVLPSARELLIATLAVLLALTVTNLVRPAEAGGGGGPTTDVAFVATGDNFPDALGAAAAAGALLAPVLLVTQNSVPASTETELNRLHPEQIYIVGGPAVISDSVKDALEALSFSPTVIRVSGANRYETAAALSEVTFPTQGLYPQAAHAFADTAEPIDFNDEIVLSVTLTPPADGTVVVTSAVEAFQPSSPSAYVTARCSITTASTKDQSYVQQWSGGAIDFSWHGQLAGTRVFEVNADEEITINLVCDVEGGDLTLHDRAMTAIFIADI